MTITVKELSYSSYNNSNLLLSNMIIIIFFCFSIYVTCKLFIKMNPYKRIEPNIFNIINIILKSTPLGNLIRIITNDKMENEVKNYKDELNDMTETLKKFKKTNDVQKKILTNINEGIYNSFIDKLNTFNSFLNSLSNIKNRISSMYETANNKFISYQEKYKEKLKKYVDALVSFLNNLNLQLSAMSATPLIQDLSRPIGYVFEEIVKTIKNNSEFIKKFYPDFDFSKVPNKVDTATIITTSNLEQSSALLQNNGYNSGG